MTAQTGGKSEASSELITTKKKSYYPLQYITVQSHTEKLHKIKTKQENKNPKIEIYVYIYEVCIHKIKTNFFFFFLKIVFFINMSVLVNKILLKKLNCSSINIHQLGSCFSPKFAVKSKSTDESQLLTWRKKKKKMKTISPKWWHPVERAKQRVLV